MRYKILATIVFISFIYVIWHHAMTRSIMIRLEPTGYNLSYSVSWGWGMEERISLTKGGFWATSHSSNWVKLFSKPYNSGAAIYVSNDGKTYYFGTQYYLYIFYPEQGRLIRTCQITKVPKPTLYGQKIIAANLGNIDYVYDREAPSLFKYVSKVDSGKNIPNHHRVQNIIKI